MATAQMSGTRLEYVVVPIEQKVKRFIHVLTEKTKKNAAGKTITYTERVEKEVEQEGGFFVYFPRGHVLRFKDKKALAAYGLDKKPRIINLEGLNDPNSPLGQLIASQDEETRRGAMTSLEQQVIKMATVKTGRNLLTIVEKKEVA